jgi:hypothetical protein
MTDAFGRLWRRSLVKTNSNCLGELKVFSGGSSREVLSDSSVARR